MYNVWHIEIFYIQQKHWVFRECDTEKLNLQSSDSIKFLMPVDKVLLVTMETGHLYTTLFFIYDTKIFTMYNLHKHIGNTRILSTPTPSR